MELGMILFVILNRSGSKFALGKIIDIEES